MAKKIRDKSPYNNYLHMTLRNYLLAVMRQRNMTQQQVADLAGYSVSTINNMVNTRSMVSTRTWSDVLQAMGIVVVPQMKSHFK